MLRNTNAAVALFVQFWIDYRKTKTTVITLTNHKGYRQDSEPIKARSRYMELTQSAGKRLRVSHDWFWFYFWLDEKVARVFLSHSFSVAMQANYFFDTSENRSDKIPILNR